MNTRFPRAALALSLVSLAAVLAACCGTAFLSRETCWSGKLSSETIALNASTPPLGVDDAVVLADNDAAFQSKLELIRGAKQTLDLAYYIYSDDYSSSVLSRALLDATERGVRVRLLVDYLTNYKSLDLFAMLEERARATKGSLEVRFYNRPTRNVVRDAVFMTMGCGAESAARLTQGCDERKYAEIDTLFAGDPGPGAASNYNSGFSGLFLSGLYGKDAEVMTLALKEGQGVDPAAMKAGAGETTPEQKAQLKQVGRLYVRSRFGAGLPRVFAKLQLLVAFGIYGEQLNPIHDELTAFLPVERSRRTPDSQRDWNHLSDFLHHKVLLADRTRLQLGGRNVEDSYHMRPNPLNRKYVFMDTDVRLDLRSGGEDLARAYDQLWNFRTMVADLREIGLHAPNDLAAARAIAGATVKEEGLPEDADATKARFEALVDQYSGDRAARIERRYAELTRSAADYASKYAPPAAPAPGPRFAIDPGAEVYYVENLPFLLAHPGDSPAERSFGAENDREGEAGKHIHTLWLAAIQNVAKTATAEQPQEIFLHNAYFSLPSNMLRLFGEMIDGEIDARHVTVRVLTNSIETTDLNIVNLVANHSLKAFADYYQQRRDPVKGARVEYHEYRKAADQPGGANLSLHSKVELYGDDVFIGSANADVRSYVQDSNNGLFIRGAKRFRSEYRAWLQQLLDDPARTKDAGAEIAAKSREQLMAEAKQTLGDLLEKYDVQVVERATLEARLEKTLNDAYTLTWRILQGGRDGRAAEREFNDLFMSL